MADKNMSWWDGVMANVSKVQAEVAGLNGGKGGNPFPGVPVQSLASLMPKNTQPFPMETPQIVQDFMSKLPKHTQPFPMFTPSMDELNRLMPKNPQAFPLPAMKSWSEMMPVNPQPFPITFGKK